MTPDTIPMQFYDALDRKARRIKDALALYERELALLTAHPTLSAYALSSLTAKVLEGQAQLDAIAQLKQRLVSDSDTTRAHQHALTELTTLALLTPFAGPDETRRRATIQTYSDFLRTLAGFETRQT